MAEHKGSLRRRITLTIITGISIILVTFGIASYYIIKKNIEDSLSKKLSLARLIRNNIDNIIRENISRLYDISLSGKVDLTDDDFGPERDAIRAAYRYSIFTDGIFLLDKQGSIILNYPERIRDTAINVMSIEAVGRILAFGKPVVTNIYTVEPSKKKILFVLVPLKDKSGNDVGVAGGEIDPTNPILTRMLGLIEIGKHSFIDIVDTNGVVISSSDPSRTLTQCNRDNFFTRFIAERKERVSTCHHCHVSGSTSEKKTMMLAFVPLEMAPWGISIQDPEEEVFTPAFKLKRTFAALAVIFIGTAFILTIGISRSIVDPLKELIRGADGIAHGEMTKPISPQGSDEIGHLSQSFETMRVRLLESRERIQTHTRELEDRVAERTREIRASRNRAAFLLQKIIKTQEEERKRIARELHDDTLQDLSAALMKIDMCKLMPEQITREKVEEMHRIILSALEGVTAIIQNLRPTLLDDVGLSAAIKSLLDMHLGERGIQYFITMQNVLDTRFPPQVEILLFRIIQEAIMNIARHAQAENVFVIFKTVNNSIHVEVEDDGIGFDHEAATHHGSHDIQDRRGLGILGMKERALLINGDIEVCSLLGLGTRIKIHIPLGRKEGAHA
jgi:signal transduction histidine kinase